MAGRTKENVSLLLLLLLSKGWLECVVEYHRCWRTAREHGYVTSHRVSVELPSAGDE